MIVINIVIVIYPSRTDDELIFPASNKCNILSRTFLLRFAVALVAYRNFIAKQWAILKGNSAFIRQPSLAFTFVQLVHTCTEYSEGTRHLNYSYHVQLLIFLPSFKSLHQFAFLILLCFASKQEKRRKLRIACKLVGRSCQSYHVSCTQILVLFHFAIL